MTCKDCTHYLSSEDALKPRPGLPGNGYCQAAKGLEDRARLFRETKECWLVPVQFRARRT